MKTIRTFAILLSSITLLTACATKGYYTKTGTVTEITNGKDGYMATIKADDDKEYTALMSILNLQKDFTRFTVGERVKVAGDTIHVGDGITIKVKQYSKN